MLGNENPRSCWATPLNIFAAFDKTYDYTLDAAASATNTKCARFYTREMDAFKQTPDGERIWLNPPYCGAKFGEKSLSDWADLAIAWSNDNEVSCCFPCDTGTLWFKRLFTSRGRKTFITPRVSFIPPEGVNESSNRGPSIVITLGVPNLIEFYDWKKDKFTKC